MDDCTITSKSALRALMGETHPANLMKSLDHIDALSARFIAMSPFLVIASHGASGAMDVSPKGDPPGFVTLLDERRLAIPERKGNRRCDTFQNVLESPEVGLIFLVPGMDETLRVSGRASLTTDPAILEPMALQGKTPRVALIVHVEEAFIHCGKALKRAGLWLETSHVDRSTYPTMGEVVHAHANLGSQGVPVEQVVSHVENDYVHGIY